MKHIGLFEGIGGFSLAARWMGWETIAHCEINDFCQRILKFHFPNSIPHYDIKETDFTIYRGKCDIVTGGFPCQPYSGAGKRLGKEDERHLWPQMLRAIREIQPSWVVGENVRGLTNWNGGMVFDEVQADLEAEGYEVLPFLLPACAVNAPHRRDRIWFIAHSQHNRHSSGRKEEGRPDSVQGKVGQTMDARKFNGADISRSYSHTNSNGFVGFDSQHEIDSGKSRLNALDDIEPTFDTHTGHKGLQGRPFVGGTTECGTRDNKQSSGLFPPTWEIFPTQPPLCSGNDGVSGELDGITFSKWRTESIKGYGNAVVPVLVYEIFKAIQQYEELK